jgi:hypothetical protein
MGVLACPACGGRLQLIALIGDPHTVGALLDSSAVSATLGDCAPPAPPPAVVAGARAGMSRRPAATSSGLPPAPPRRLRSSRSWHVPVDRHVVGAVSGCGMPGRKGASCPRLSLGGREGGEGGADERPVCRLRSSPRCLTFRRGRNPAQPAGGDGGRRAADLPAEFGRVTAEEVPEWARLGRAADVSREGLREEESSCRDRQ